MHFAPSSPESPPHTPSLRVLDRPRPWPSHPGQRSLSSSEGSRSEEEGISRGPSRLDGGAGGTFGKRSTSKLVRGLTTARHPTPSPTKNLFTRSKLIASHSAPIVAQIFPSLEGLDPIDNVAPLKPPPVRPRLTKTSATPPPSRAISLTSRCASGAEHIRPERTRRRSGRSRIASIAEVDGDRRAATRLDVCPRLVGLIVEQRPLLQGAPADDTDFILVPSQRSPPSLASLILRLLDPKARKASRLRRLASSPPIPHASPPPPALLPTLRQRSRISQWTLMQPTCFISLDLLREDDFTIEFELMGPHRGGGCSWRDKWSCGGRKRYREELAW